MIGRQIWLAQYRVALLGVFVVATLRTAALAQAPARPGDVNCDGAVNDLDVNVFVLRLTNPAHYRSMYPDCPDGTGDINGDGEVDFADINPFRALLVPSSPASPDQDAVAQGALSAQGTSAGFRQKTVGLFVTDWAGDFGLDIPANAPQPTFSTVDSYGNDFDAYDWTYGYFTVSDFAQPQCHPAGQTEQISELKLAYIWLYMWGFDPSTELNGLAIHITPEDALEPTYYVCNDMDGIGKKRWDGTATPPAYPEWHNNPQTMVAITAYGLKPTAAPQPWNLYNGDAGDNTFLVGWVYFPWIDTVYSVSITGISFYPPQGDVELLGASFMSSSSTPPSGACCLPNGQCLGIACEACYDMGGAFFWGEDCSMNPCSAKGACCFNDGSCQANKTLTECLAATGAIGWREDNVCNRCPQNPNPSYHYGFQIWQGSNVDPVNTATGNFHRREVDLSIAARGAPLVFERFYNSLDPNLDPNSAPFGSGWGHSYYVGLDPNSAEPDTDVAVRWADGQVTGWKDVGGGTYIPSQLDFHDKLQHNGDGTWTVTKTNLDAYLFDSTGQLTSITDKNGNAVTLTYGDSGHPKLATKVHDPAGRGWLTLSYGNAEGKWRLQSVSDWTGRTVQYGYTNGRLTQVTDVLSQTITYRYDANGYLDQITDQRDVDVVTNQYDATGRVMWQWDGNGNPTEFIYGGRAENETVIRHEVTTPSGPTILDTIHAHDPNFKKQIGIEDPLAQQVGYGYWDLERTTITDRNGRTTGFTYDTKGNVTSAIEADDPNDPHDGGVTAVVYDPNSALPHVPRSKTNALGHMTEWTYDTPGNVTKEKRYLDPNQPQAIEKNWTYNGFGQRLTEIDERGHTHYWHRNETTGLLEYEIDREGNYTWYGYDGLWRRIWVTDGRGADAGDPAYTTHYVYDNADRLTEIHGPPVGDPPHSIVQWFGYDEIGNRIWVTDGNGGSAEDPNHTTWYYYDNNSNLIRVEEPLGRITRYAYDELNRKVKMADANGDLETQYTRYTYDGDDRLIETEDPEGNLWTYTYDAQGNLLTETDPGGVTVTHTYDALNRRTKTCDELNNCTLFEYDQLGRLTKQIDATNKETSFAYDALGRLVCVIDAAGGWTEYTYDAAGNLTQIEDARDAVVSIRQYDALNRLTYAEDGNGNFYQYGYDAAGNQTWVMDANGQRTDLTYDAANRVIYIDYPGDSWVAYEYDDNGNRVAMLEPEGVTTFEYDSLNRLIFDTDRFGQAVGYSYDPVGNRIGLTYSDTKQVTYGYDAANRLTTITDWAGRQTQYTYACCYRLGTVTYPNGVVETRTYDTAGRLDTLVTRDSQSNVLLSYDYTRDGVGNPTSVAEMGTLQPMLEQLVTESEYDADNRLVESSQGMYLYDANGNLTSRTVNGVTTTFGYDAEDRLVSQTTGTATVQHVYDGQSYRIARVENGVEKRYVLDRGRSMSHVLCETEAAGNITAYYIHGPQIVARIVADGTAEYYHTNDIGNVVALTDQTQQVTDRYAHEAFGLPRGHEGATQQPFTYVGGLGVMAEADDLYFMRARFYDPDAARFLAKDPLEGPLSHIRELHRFVYALNRPLVLTDPQGMSTSEEIAKIVVQLVLGMEEVGWSEISPSTGELLGAYGEVMDASDLLEWSMSFAETKMQWSAGMCDIIYTLGPEEYKIWFEFYQADPSRFEDPREVAGVLRRAAHGIQVAKRFAAVEHRTRNEARARMACWAERRWQQGRLDWRVAYFIQHFFPPCWGSDNTPDPEETDVYSHSWRLK